MTSTIYEISCFHFYKFSYYFLYHATQKKGITEAAIENVLGKTFVSYSCQVKLQSKYVKNTC